MQFSLRKLFLLTTVVAALVCLLNVLVPLGAAAMITLILAPTPLLLMLRGWKLEAEGDKERGSNYVASGLLILVVLGPVLVGALLALTFDQSEP